VRVGPPGSDCDDVIALGRAYLHYVPKTYTCDDCAVQNRLNGWRCCSGWAQYWAVILHIFTYLFIDLFIYLLIYLLDIPHDALAWYDGIQWQAKVSKYTKIAQTQIKIKLCQKGAHTCARPLFCFRDLYINPLTLKLEGGLDILKMYLQTENEVAMLRHSKLLIEDDTCMAMKNTNIALKVKGQGELSPIFSHFERSLWDMFLQSYIDVRPVVFEISCEQTHRHAATSTPTETIPARSMCTTNQ